MKLHNLSNVKGAVHRRKRVGCGEGGGHGKTSGKGGKGQTARSGGSIRPGFEGGQMPLYRKLPRRGFSNHRFRASYVIVNLDAFAKLPETVTNVDIEVLAQHGIVRSAEGALKILGRGEMRRALTIHTNHCTNAARTKIESAGGQVVAGL